MAGEELLERQAGRRLAQLAAAAVADLDDLARRQHHLHRDHQVARVAEARAQQRPATGPDPPADQRARVRGRVVGIEDAVPAQLLVELEHVDARPDGHRAVHEVDLVDLVHELAVDEDAAAVAQRHGAVGQARPAGARDDRDAAPVGELDRLGHLMRGARQHGHVGHVLGPAVHRERRRHARAVHARGQARQHAVVVVVDRAQLVDDRVVDGALDRDASCRHLRAARVPPTSMPADSASDLEQVEHLEWRSAASESGRSDHGHALTRASTSSASRARPGAG